MTEMMVLIGKADVKMERTTQNHRGRKDVFRGVYNAV